MSDKPFNVLFLCTGNSARSILAECILNRIGQGKYRAYSAGSHPLGKVNPYALAELENNGYDTRELRSKSWSEFEAPGSPEIDFVFTVCDNAAAEVCPVWPGRPVTAHWGVADPAAESGDERAKQRAFAQTFRELHNRIAIFVDLPLASLDRQRLRQELNRIGRIGLEEKTGEST
jgi:arsenate reductase